MRGRFLCEKEFGSVDHEPRHNRRTAIEVPQDRCIKGGLIEGDRFISVVDRQHWRDFSSHNADLGLQTSTNVTQCLIYEVTAELILARGKLLNKPELVVDFGNLHLADFMIGLTPDGSALFARDVSADEIYSLEVELP